MIMANDDDDDKQKKKKKINRIDFTNITHWIYVLWLAILSMRRINDILPNRCSMIVFFLHILIFVY